MLTYDVTYITGGERRHITLVTKTAWHNERAVLALLNAQGHPHVPRSYAADLYTPTPLLMCQQHAGVRRRLSAAQVRTVAAALAGIHAANQGEREHLPYMRRLNRHTMFTWWLPVWQRALADPPFVQVFAPAITPTAAAIDRLASTLDRLWEEADSLTILHTDLSAWHVLVDSEHPYLIDWDQTRYGPWYFDLPLLFTKRTVATYHAALRAAGVPLDAATFAANFDAAWAFVGFKYLIPPLEAWLKGERRQRRREIQTLLNRALANQAPQ